MTYVVTEHCIGLACGDCVESCPADCFYSVPNAAFIPGLGFLRAYGEGEEKQVGMLVIHPDLCINCGACETECPVEAIHEDVSVPDESRPFIQINASITRGLNHVDQKERRCKRSSENN